MANRRKQVKVWGGDGKESEWSETATFEMGLLNKNDWIAKWIEPIQKPVQSEEQFDFKKHVEGHIPTTDLKKLNPCPIIRKNFLVKRGIKRARIYATAHGVYELELNGKRVGDYELAPEFTAYDQYLQYQTYDVTNHITEGLNAIGATLADGWYAGRIGMIGDSGQYGKMLGLLIQLEIEYMDESIQVICSDETFKCSFGNITYSDIFIGEKVDNRLQKEGWSKVGFCDDDWKSVIVTDYGYDNLVAQYGEPVKIVEELPVSKVIYTPNNETVIDFGQIIAGRVRMKAKGANGTVITLEHSEVLDEKGNFLNNISGRNKDQKDTFILKGGGEEIFEPKFTFHGFRYVKVCGYPEKVKVENFEAVVISSNMKKTGSFECSDQRINRLQNNIFWSQRGNMISIPTDCPQRERAGWTGDIQIFAPTACYNMDMVAFLTRWLRNVVIEQHQDGSIPAIIPFIPSYRNFGRNSTSSAGWGDSIIIVPWALYQAYGDKLVLEDNYEAMVKWVEFMRKSAESGINSDISEHDVKRKERQKYLWNTGQNLGDWLIPSIMVDASVKNMMKCAFETQEVISTCFYAYSSELLSRIAELLGKTEDANRYSHLSSKIKEAFAEEYLMDDGRFKANYQGVYVMALHLNMVKSSISEKVMSQLLRLIEKNEYRLDTGFVSTPFLLDTLCAGGYEDVALRILFQTECPSWLYEVENGATTIWESWTAIQTDGTVTPVSYNHYAFGCVGDWMYRYLGGINKLEPGYKRIAIKLNSNCGLRHVKAKYESVQGLIISEWEIKDQLFEVNVLIPGNTTAEVFLPNARISTILESGTNFKNIEGLISYSETNEGVMCEIGSGNYNFSYPIFSTLHIKDI